MKTSAALGVVLGALAATLGLTVAGMGVSAFRWASEGEHPGPESDTAALTMLASIDLMGMGVIVAFAALATCVLGWKAWRSMTRPALLRMVVAEAVLALAFVGTALTFDAGLLHVLAVLAGWLSAATCLFAVVQWLRMPRMSAEAVAP